MRVKPTKPDEHGVRWCDCNCPQWDHGPLRMINMDWCKALDSNINRRNPLICEPWVRELVKAAAALDDSVTEADDDIVSDRICSLLHDDEVGVE